MQAPYRLLQGLSPACRALDSELLKRCFSIAACRLQQPHQFPKDANPLVPASEKPNVLDRLPKAAAKRTTLTNPADHTRDHEGLFYTIPRDRYEKLFLTIARRTLPLDFAKNVDTFQECALMIRPPGLEVIDYIKRSNLSAPPVRYCLYGRLGSGKTLTLAYLLHYFALNDWLIFHVPQLSYLTRRCKEITESTFKPGRYDLPLDSVDLLQNFLSQNTDLLRGTPEAPSMLRTHQQYIWSKRELTEANAPLVDVVEMGIMRPRYANDAVGVLVKELKLNASKKNAKVAMVIDAVNGLWGPTTLHPKGAPNFQYAAPESVSLFLHLKKAVENDWTNGAIVTTVDRHRMPDEPILLDDSGNNLPRYLLKKQGFDAMEPFLPVLVKDYSEKELTNCIDFYLEKKWLANEHCGTQNARDEIKFLSGMNPGNVWSIASRI